MTSSPGTASSVNVSSSPVSDHPFAFGMANIGLDALEAASVPDAVAAPLLDSVAPVMAKSVLNGLFHTARRPIGSGVALNVGYMDHIFTRKVHVKLARKRCNKHYVVRRVICPKRGGIEIIPYRLPGKNWVEDHDASHVALLHGRFRIYVYPVSGQLS